MLTKRFRRSLIASVAAAVLAAGILHAVVAQAAPACRVDYTVTNQWPGGFGASVTINNLGDPVTSWSLT